MFVQALVSMRGFTTMAMPGLGGQSGLRRNYQLFARAYMLQSCPGSINSRAMYQTKGHRHDSAIAGRQTRIKPAKIGYTFVMAPPWEKLI